NLCMYMLRGDAPGGEAAGQILQERGRPTQIEVRLAWHAKLFERRHIEASMSVEVQAEPILLTWPAVEDVAAAVGQGLEEAACLLCKRVFVAVTCSKQPPDFPWRSLCG